ncbi:MAG TPA: hypothetical protein VF039_09060 [Longimicrobiales bacterium]
MHRLLLLTLVLAACGTDDGVEGESATTSTAARVPPPASVSPDEFRSLRWLEGSWRGLDDGGQAFYERYSFVDDSTIRAQSSPDSTFPTVDGASEIRLRGGRVTTGDEGMEWTVTAITQGGVRFDPVRGARNSFEWRRESDDEWLATLQWVTSSGERQERRYTMRRMQ